MPFSVHGASTRNDNVNQAQKSQSERQGYLGDAIYEDADGDKQVLSAAGVNTPGAPDWDMTGGQEGDQVINGWRVAGTNAFDRDVERDRQMGAAGQNRTAVQLDQTQANESRGLQMGGLGYLRNQANGSAPSAAAIMGQRANQQATMQAGQAVTGMKGGIGAHIAGQQNASMQGAEQAMQLNARNAAMRAAEVSKGQAGYAAGAQGMEGQDIQAATTNAQLAAQQRALNEQRQQGFEQRGFGVRVSQQQAADDWRRMRQAEENAISGQKNVEDAQDQQALRDAYGVGMMAVGAASDERMKTNIHPMRMGSLGRMMHGGR